MEWSDEGLIIGVRRHGETSVIVEAMTPEFGRHMGLVRGGRSRRHAATLQPGNTVHLHWRARLEEHLGVFSIELKKGRAADMIANRRRLYASQLVLSHLRLLPERDPHPRLFGFAIEILDADGDLCQRMQMLSLFELALLDELGFGLDLSACALSGRREGLSHVSPRTGRAVTADAAGKFVDRLLPLPRFFRETCMASPGEVLQAMDVTGHFLHRHIWDARNVEPPPERDQLMNELHGDKVKNCPAGAK